MKRDNEQNSILHDLLSWVTDITIAVVLAVFTVYAFGNQISISGNSMSPLLESGDVVLMNRIAFDLGKPSRYQIVVFEREEHRQNVKRVVGLPGETVLIRDGSIYIDGSALEDEHLPERISLSGVAAEEVVLGPEEYFLLGDNPDSSEDSRFANVGNVKREQIVGKVWFRVSPIGKLGPVK